MEEKAPEEEEDDDCEVNPYTSTNKSNKEINYEKLIKKFGCYPLSS